MGRRSFGRETWFSVAEDSMDWSFTGASDHRRQESPHIGHHEPHGVASMGPSIHRRTESRLSGW